MVRKKFIAPGIEETVREEKCPHCARRGRWRWCVREEVNLIQLGDLVARGRGSPDVTLKIDYRVACEILSELEFTRRR